jgi:hypothetical protein
LELLSGSTTSGDDSDENADKNLGKLDVLDLAAAAELCHSRREPSGISC